MRRAGHAGRAGLHRPRYARIALTLVALVVAVTSTRAVALADSVDPCRSMVIPVCSLVPILPGLDHDVDLTVNPDAALPVDPDDGPPGLPVADDGAP
jgi:hypothetical protein